MAAKRKGGEKREHRQRTSNEALFHQLCRVGPDGEAKIGTINPLTNIHGRWLDA